MTINLEINDTLIDDLGKLWGVESLTDTHIGMVDPYDIATNRKYYKTFYDLRPNRYRN